MLLWPHSAPFLQQQDFFAPLREHVQLDCKTVVHAPHEKLLDIVVSMLADCASLKQINTRLRPDTVLAAAWGRDGFADQSTISPGAGHLDAEGCGPATDRRRANLQA